MDRPLIYWLIQEHRHALQAVSTNAERNLLIYMIGVLFLVSGLIITFFVVFQKRKNKLLMEQMAQQKRFDEELIKTQQEIQDETLKQVGRELHDNVGQLLALTSMHLNLAKSSAEEVTKQKLNNASDSLKASLTEVRALSKSLNSDVILNSTFSEIIQNEISRINKLGTLKITLEQKGEYRHLNKNQDRLMLFRIIQEFISNTLKYSEASKLNLTLKYSPSYLDIGLSDNGIGFDLNNVKKGSGLINMEKRAALIHTEFEFSSELNQGTTLKLQYPFLNV